MTQEKGKDDTDHVACLFSCGYGMGVRAGMVFFSRRGGLVRETLELVHALRWRWI